MPQQMIVCLGNPGSEYMYSRHNAGWIWVDKFYQDLSWQNKKDAQIALFENTLFLKPMKYMNNSGEVTLRWWKWYGLKNITPENLLCIHDDIDFELGKWKWQENRGAAGHNGVRSIIFNFDSQNFSRLRLGIGKQPKSILLEEYVLQKFSTTQLQFGIDGWKSAYSYVEFWRSNTKKSHHSIPRGVAVRGPDDISPTGPSSEKNS